MTTPAPPAVAAIREALNQFPKGWHTVFQEVRERNPGVAEIGALWEDSDSLAEVVTVDTGNYYDNASAMPIARYMIACNPAAMTAVLDHIAHLEARLREVEAERDRLSSLINTPHTDGWVEASKLEAAHQIERWSADHDAGKQPEDWFWLLGYLGGKAVAAFRSGNKEKGLHHIVSSSAALLNWHRNVTGDSTAMRPGIDAAQQGGQ